jgi:hypothetical protein
MITRLKNWIQASRRRKLERIAYLSNQEKHEVDLLREESSPLNLGGLPPAERDPHWMRPGE